MGCLILLIGLFSPRLAIAVMVLFTNLVGRAFDGGWILPLVGFLFLPWSTLAYTLLYISGHRVAGFEWVVVAFAFFLDLGAWDRGRASQRRRDARA